MARNKQTQNTPIPLEQQPFRLPENWQWVRLGEILDVRDGTHDTPKYVTNGIPLITSKNLSNGRIDFSTAKFISQEDHYAISQRSKVDKNDILFAMIGSIGNPVLFNGEEEFSIKNMALFKHVTDNISMKYVYWFLFFEQDKMKIYATGGLQPFVSLNYLRKYLFPLPSLSEQHRIVEKIEQLFTQLDQAAEKLMAVIDGFELRKTAILHKACTGKLVPQNLTDEPAQTLLQRIQQEKQTFSGSLKKQKQYAPMKQNETPFRLPENWVWVKWGDLSQSIQYGYNAPAKSSGCVKMVRITDIQDGKILWDTVPFCADISESEIEKYLLRKNDILFARTGGTVGKSYLVKEVPEKAIYAGYLIRTQYNSNYISPEYLKFFMESELYWQQLRSGTIATAQPNCNGKTLAEMLVPLPPLAEQKRIVEKIEQLLEPSIQAKQQAEDALQKIALIKKAILAQAFRGEL